MIQLKRNSCYILDIPWDKLMRMYLAAALHNVIKTASKILGLSKLPCLFNGKWVWFPVESWPEIVLDHEPHIAQVIERELKSGGCFLDVGAHIGLWSLYAVRLKGVEVVAIEPSPTFRLLERAARWSCEHHAGQGRLRERRG